MAREAPAVDERAVGHGRAKRVAQVLEARAILRQLDGLVLILLYAPGNEALQAHIPQYATPETRRIAIARQHDDGHAHPNAIAGGRVTVEREWIECDVHPRNEPHVFIVRALVGQLDSIGRYAALPG